MLKSRNDLYGKGLKKVLFSVVFMLSVFSALSQQTEWSNSRKLKGSAIFTQVLGENENGIYLIRYRNRFFTRNIIIEKYRNHLGYNFSRNIMLKKNRLVAADINPENLLFFTASFNKTEQTNELYVQYYDGNVLPKTKPRLVDKSVAVESFDKGDFSVQSTMDKSKYLVYHTNKQNGHRSLHLKLFNGQLQIQKELNVELQINYEQYQLQQLVLDDAGNTYLLVREKARITKRGLNEPSAYRLYIWHPDNGALTDFLLGDTSAYIHQLGLSINRNNGIVNVSGFYSRLYPDRIAGAYLCKADPDDLSKTVQYFTPFGTGLLSELIGEKAASEMDEAYDFKQLKNIPLNNGSLVMVSERTSMSSEEDVIYVNGIPQNTSRNIYNFDDVLVLCLDSAGKLSWHKVINKSQSSLNDGGYYSSVIPVVTKNNLHIIFNDRMRGNGNVLQYTISSTGASHGDILLHSEREFIAVIPSESQQIAANVVLIPTTKDKKFALLKLIY